jgi:hypothetical protein
MPLKHNKKRNIGLVYEFLARYLAEAILDNRDEDIKKTKLLIRKHFNKGTDLYRELKMFRALNESTVSSRDVATKLISRIKESVKDQSQQRLDLEKTSLIHEINSVLKDEKFFDVAIKEYKTFATIQVLLNSWRSCQILESVDVESLELEERLIQHLMTNKNSKELNNVLLSSDANSLIVSIMAEKINAKFSKTLNEEQKKIIKFYAVSDNDSLKTILCELKDRASKTFENILQKEDYSQETKEKLLETKKLMLNEYEITDSVNEEVITFFMGLSGLEQELKNER